MNPEATIKIHNMLVMHWFMSTLQAEKFINKTSSSAHMIIKYVQIFLMKEPITTLLATLSWYLTHS